MSASLEVSVGIAQAFKGSASAPRGSTRRQESAGSRFERGLVDLGVSKEMFGSYTVGVAVQNIGQDADLGSNRAELPLQTTLGVSRGGPVGEFDLVGTAAVSWVRSDFVAPAAVVEVNYSWLSGYNIALRAGARRPLPGEEAFTAGAGFTMDRLSIDYALETLGRRPRRPPHRPADSVISLDCPTNRRACRRRRLLRRRALRGGCTQALKLTKDDSPSSSRTS